jgi:hypothetical protein
LEIVACVDYRQCDFCTSAGPSYDEAFNLRLASAQLSQVVEVLFVIALAYAFLPATAELPPRFDNASSQRRSSAFTAPQRPENHRRHAFRRRSTDPPDSDIEWQREPGESKR